MKNISAICLIGLSLAEDSVDPFGQAPGSFLDAVFDDEGTIEYLKAAPKPGYSVPFDLRSNELVIMSSDVEEFEAGGIIIAEFWNVNGDKFNTNTCEMTLIDADSDTYWDSFTVTVDDENCKDYGGK